MTAGPAGLDWIAVDWGTTRLRAWAMGAGGTVLARAGSDRGMGVLGPAEFEPALLDLAGGWIDGPGPVDVVACGMVGSRQGWIEAPYRAVPCTPLAPGAMVRPETRDGRIAVHVIAGLKQARPADVMRGEETQMAGFLTCHPGFDGVLCLPGTHSKWARISAGEVVSFQTYMTGELFSLLGSHSVLRHGSQGRGWDATAFDEGVDQAFSRPERLAQRLFAIRAEGLLDGLSADAARARLSGLLIGSEMAAARPYWLGQDVVVIASDGLAGAYGAAFAALGVAPRQADPESMVIAGLGAVRSALGARAA